MSKKVEFGDWQTPPEFALRAVEKIKEVCQQPAVIIEPTCGIGAFLEAAQKSFPDSRKIIGYDVNEEYVAQATRRMDVANNTNIHLEAASFFTLDWKQILHACAASPLLLLGNPPWVTNSTLGTINSENLPQKTNLSSYKGLDALTGKSNFDISEWMLIHLLECAQGSDTYFGFLIKTSVARKLMKHAKAKDYFFSEASIYHFNALKVFSAAVDACLFIFRSNREKDFTCREFADLETEECRRFGYYGEMFVSNVETYARSAALEGTSPLKWRSGIKHDCSNVFELKRKNGRLINGFGDEVDVEDEAIYPLLKSSDLHNGRASLRWLIVVQKKVGEDTADIERRWPKLWRYLQEHASRLNSRKSSIYKKKPPFSIFGVGDYSFAPWKIAISGLYKDTAFQLIGPKDGKPVMLDDTCYFIYFEREADAREAFARLESQQVKDFVTAISFRDAKRPVTVDILNRLAYGNLSIPNSGEQARSPS